jgi:hypothetical protein
MYRRELPGQMKIEVPFNVALNAESKWVKMADMLPWDEIEEQYVKNFTGKNEGQVAKSARLAFCAVYIYISEGITDEKVARYIQENPHMQYFCGYAAYTPQPPFDPSLMNTSANAYHHRWLWS